MSYFKEALKMRGIPGGMMRRPQLDLPAAEVEELREILTTICAEAGIQMELQR